METITFVTSIVPMILSCALAVAAPPNNMMKAYISYVGAAACFFIISVGFGGTNDMPPATRYTIAAALMALVTVACCYALDRVQSGIDAGKITRGINMSETGKNTAKPAAKAGSITLNGAILRAGDGAEQAGGDINIISGDGHNGNNAGDIHIGPGDFRAGDGGTKGKGGDLTFKAGNAN